MFAEFISESVQILFHTLMTSTKFNSFFSHYFLQVLTFLIDPSRFRYPERAIVFLAICYLVVGCAYVAGLGAGDSAACREPFPPPIRLGKLPMYSTITMVSVAKILTFCKYLSISFEQKLLLLYVVDINES